MARRKEELLFDCHGEVSVDEIRDCREPAAVEYEPPTSAKWRALLGVLFMPRWSGAAKAVMGCLISHANPTTGRCDPGHARIAKMLELPVRTVERTMRFLRTTRYVWWERRGDCSNAYHIDWDALDDAFDTSQENVRGPVKSDGRVPSKVADRVPTEMTGKTVKRNRKGKHNPERVRLGTEPNLTVVVDPNNEEKKEASNEEVVVEPHEYPTHSLQAQTSDDPYTLMMADLRDREARAAIEWVCTADTVFNAAVQAEELRRGAGAEIVLEEYRKHMQENAA
jgi:hypothetical protein